MLDQERALRALFGEPTVLPADESFDDCAGCKIFLVENLRGCFKRDWATDNKTTHGHSTKGVRSPVYISWSNMIQRCGNPNHSRFFDRKGRDEAAIRWTSGGSVWFVNQNKGR
jgi:hypothetical protein